MKLKSQFENKSHIFEFESYDTKNKAIKWRHNEFNSSRKLEQIWFMEKDNFVKAYNNFLFRKSDYDARGDPHTFSCLLYGPSGCGQTSLLKSMINYDKSKRNLTSHLFVVPFRKVTNTEIFKHIMLDKKINGINIPMEKRIYVFQDFDVSDNAEVFNISESLKHKESIHVKGRKRGESITESKVNNNDIYEDLYAKPKVTPRDDVTPFMFNEDMGIEKEDKDTELNLIDILNTLDGLCERSGQRTIWTTYKSPPQKYFNAAFLRPGRMDMIVELGKCNHMGIEYLVREYFGVMENVKNSINLNGIDQDRFTPAQVKQICKEGCDADGTLDLMRAICNEPVVMNKRFRETDDMIKPKIAKLHAGHWFRPPIKSTSHARLVSIKSNKKKVVIANF